VTVIACLAGGFVQRASRRGWFAGEALVEVGGVTGLLNDSAEEDCCGLIEEDACMSSVAQPIIQKGTPYRTLFTL
jgi:hypothetical protein